jgi:hypothetical protein
MSSSPVIIFFHFLFVLIDILSIVGWANDAVEIVISEYRERKCLRDRVNLFYKPHLEKNGAWEGMGQLLGCEI